jgi:hypothetical protein
MRPSGASATVRDVSSDRRFFLVERYLPSLGSGSVGAAVGRLRQSAPGARHLFSLLVPEEETCLSVFEAADAAAVGVANEDAEFQLDRIVEVEIFPAPPVRRASGHA